MAPYIFLIKVTFYIKAVQGLVQIDSGFHLAPKSGLYEQLTTQPIDLLLAIEPVALNE